MKKILISGIILFLSVSSLLFINETARLSIDKTDYSDQKISTKNLIALKAYQNGLVIFRKSNLKSEIDLAQNHFEFAFNSDSLFADAIAMSAACDLLNLWLGYKPYEEMISSAKFKIDIAKSLNPDSPQVLFSLGTYYYYGFRDYPNALRYYKNALDLDSNNSEVLSFMGYVQRRLGRIKASIQTHEKAVEINPDDRIIMYEIIQSYAYLRQYPKAVEWCEKLLENNADLDSHCFCELRKAELRVDPAELSQNMDELTQKYEVSAPVHFYSIYLSSLLVRNFEKSIRELDKIKNPVFAYDSYFMVKNYLMAETFEWMGEIEKANQYYAESLLEMKKFNENIPDNPYIMSALALNSIAVGDSAAALDLIQSARKLMPFEIDPISAPKILNLEAEVYLKLGQFDKCLRQLEYSASIPAGIHAFNLLHPKYDEIRDNPRFIKIFNSLTPKDKIGV